MKSDSLHIVHSMNKICRLYSSRKCIHLLTKTYICVLFGERFHFVFCLLFFHRLLYQICFVIVLNKTHKAVCLNIYDLFYGQDLVRNFSIVLFPVFISYRR